MQDTQDMQVIQDMQESSSKRKRDEDILLPPIQNLSPPNHTLFCCTLPMDFPIISFESAIQKTASYNLLSKIKQDTKELPSKTLTIPIGSDNSDLHLYYFFCPNHESFRFKRSLVLHRSHLCYEEIPFEKVPCELFSIFIKFDLGKSKLTAATSVIHEKFFKILRFNFCFYSITGSDLLVFFNYFNSKARDRALSNASNLKWFPHCSSTPATPYIISLQLNEKKTAPMLNLKKQKSDKKTDVQA